MGKRRFLYIVGLCSILISAVGQKHAAIQEQFRFNYLTVDEGLSNNRVYSSVQDSYGFIWFGTRTGIERFDGYELKSYEHFYSDTIKKELSDVRTSLCDSRGRVWFSGTYGASYYNEQNDRIEQFFDPAFPDRLSPCIELVEDHDSTLWFTGNQEIVNYNPKTKKFKYFVSNPEVPGSFPLGNPGRILVDDINNIWIGYEDIGAAYFDRKANKFILYSSDENPNSLAGNNIERLYLDNKGSIWFGHNNNGISKFNPDTKDFTHYMPDSSVKQSGRVRGFLHDGKGNFWIGTQNGLYLFDEKNESFFYYAHNKHPISRLGHNSIMNIIMDDQEGLWIGTFAGGVSFTNLNTSGFVRYDYSYLESEYYLNDKIVYSLAVDKKNNVWVGTENGGLNYLDRKTGRFTYYTFDPDNYNTLRSNNIKEIIVTDENNIWFCTYKGGFSFFNTTTGQFTHYGQSPENPNGFPEDLIFSMIFDPLQPEIIWLGTSSGVYFYNLNTNEYERVREDLQGFINPPEMDSWTHTIVNYKDEKLLFGTNKLVILDVTKRGFKTISSANGIEISSVSFVLVDKKGFVWFDIANIYLVRMNMETSTYQVFSEEDGLPGIKMLEAIDDDMGNLWISSNRGLFQLVGFVNNQDSLSYISYDKSDNLQSLEFQYHSKAVGPDGEIFFGGINGFNSFFPQNIITNPYPPKVHITGMRVENKPVGINEKIYGKKILTGPMINTRKIKIHYKIKVFTIEFTSLHYVSPEDNQFQYKLEGYDDNWTTVDASVRFATYSNLPADDYVFKVRAANNNGLWSPEPAILEIKVTPPFWKTIPFYLSIVLIITFLIILFVKGRERQLRHDKEVLQAKLDMGEEEINKSKKEIEKQRQTLEEKEIQERVQKWFNEGLAKFSDILSNEKDSLEKLTLSLISNIVSYVEADMGGIFLVNNSEDKQEYLELVAHYSFNKEKLKTNTFYPGEGLVGVCYKSKEIAQLDNLPQNYAHLDSGLGQCELKNLLLIPLINDETIIGVLELGSVIRIEEYKVEFLQKLCENIVSVISAIKANKVIKDMLQNSQIQAEQLQAQDEEMRQNVEELKATQEEAERRENQLKEEVKRFKIRVEDMGKKIIELTRALRKEKKKQNS